MKGENAPDKIFGMNLLSVSQVNENVKKWLEKEFPLVAVKGEIGDLARPRSGHIYFSLRDDKGLLSSVMWRGLASKLPFRPKEGMEIIVVGRLTLYPQRGQYQIIVSEMLPSGVGELHRSLEELKRKLAAEGIFDEAHKKSLPYIPFKIGVITSATGAAVHDIIRTALHRFPNLVIRIIPVVVQGIEAASDMRKAISIANKPGVCDVILLGRGGGSLEDLWVFNSEEVVRAIFDSNIPVVSCVGHETDITLSDLVADVRASTPTRAAELVVPVLDEVLQGLKNLIEKADLRINNRLDNFRSRLELLAGAPALSMPYQMLHEFSQFLDGLYERMNKSVCNFGENAWNNLEFYVSRIEDLSPLNILKRGYTVTKSTSGRIIRSADLLCPGDLLDIVFIDGIGRVKVKEVNKVTFGRKNV